MESYSSRTELTKKYKMTQELYNYIHIFCSISCGMYNKLHYDTEYSFLLYKPMGLLWCNVFMLN